MTTLGVAQQAQHVASAAASRAGVTVRVLDQQADLDAVIALLASVWDVGGGEPVMTVALARAFAHSGNYVSAAFLKSTMVGASVGFIGHDPGGVHLHSHITGVALGGQTRGVGYALKQHQRAWALDIGVDSIHWTFDPLVSRNAYFNITKLGADITGYRVNFYGSMQDGINRRDESDRCMVVWNLASQRAIDAANGADLEPRIAVDPSLTMLSIGDDGSPVLGTHGGEALLACIPRDIVALRATDAEKAWAWRRALRRAFEWAFQSGYRVTGMTQSGCYVLRRSP